MENNSMNVLADASLPGLDQAFPKPFHLTRYHHPDEIPQLLTEQDILFCRSTLKVNCSLLKNHPLSYVATASSGTDHLDLPWLSSQNIQVVDAKGSNAQAVADYVVACLAFLEQKQLIQGRKAGIIGLGEVGTQVAARLQAANFTLFTYDPLKEIQKPFSFQSCQLEDLFQVDLLCIHAELHDTKPYPSTHLINTNVLTQLKSGCIIINASRGGVVNEDDLLKSTNPLIYCTDVYLNEPAINQGIIDKTLLCTPHIAGHSIEAKYLAVAMVSKKLHLSIGLPIPEFAVPRLPHPVSAKKNIAWHQLVLEIYNPFVETSQLKQARDKESAFIDLRKKHRNRHNLSLYFADLVLDYKTKLLLGM